MGKIGKEVKKFIRSNLEEILSRKIGLFLVSGGSEEIESYYKKNFPEELLKKAKAKDISVLVTMEKGTMRWREWC